MIDLLKKSVSVIVFNQVEKSSLIK